MKLFLALILVLSLPLMANFTEKELADESVQVEIMRAIDDFKSGVFDENAGDVYKRAMIELEKSGVKSNTAEGIAIGVFGTLFLSSASSASSASSYEAAVEDCMNRCRWKNYDYYTCRSDCRRDYYSH